MTDQNAVRVQIPMPLRALAGGNAEVELAASDVAGVIAALESRHPGLRDRLCDASGALRSYVRFFVNDQDVRALQDQRTPLKQGDVVAIVPAIAGGAGSPALRTGRPRRPGRPSADAASTSATLPGPAGGPHRRP